MGIEHMGRDPAVHLEPIRRGNAQIEPQRGDAADFGQRRFLLGGFVVAQPLFELAQDRIFAMPAHADDERHIEFFSIGVVEPVKSGELLFRKLVEPGACLLEFGIVRHRAFAGGFAREVRVSLDRREAPAGVGAPHCFVHGRGERVEAGKRPCRTGCYGNPWRVFEYFAESGDECAPDPCH